MTDPRTFRPAITRDLLRRLPKAELHVHLDGSVRPATLIELGRQFRKAMPAADPDELAEYMVVRDATNLEEYLQRFSVTLSVMQHEESLERIAYELAEDAAAEGIRYIEVRYCPMLNVREGLTLAQAVEAPLRGLLRAERELGIIGRVIITALRNQPPDDSVELARLAVVYRDRGVVGFDLAGAERGFPASVHAAAFELARENDLACTCHAGEGFGAASIRNALQRCCVDRIGHGTALLEDASLMQYVADRRIPLEICITSNVQTRAADSYETHPVRAYHDAGVVVCLNTDNRLMSGTTLVEEYELAAKRLEFDFDDLAAVALNSFEASFLPWQERRRLIASAAAAIEALRAGSGEPVSAAGAR